MGITFATPNGGASVMNGTSNTQNNNGGRAGSGGVGSAAANVAARRGRELEDEKKRRQDEDKLANRKDSADRDAALNAEAKRIADESKLDTARMTDYLEKERTAKRRESTQNVNDPNEGGGLLGSFMPKVISESLKGEGNYDPEWVNKNKAAGAKHLEDQYATGQLQRGLSNFTDQNGNAIGGVANSEDNTAMQQMAANGVEDPLSALSSKVSNEAGLDTSFSGAFKQAVNGADGHNYEGGGGLLKYSQENDGGQRGEQSAALADRRAQEQTQAMTQAMTANGIPVDDLGSNKIDMEKFSGNLGFTNVREAQTYWDSMTPEAQAIFNSKENPEVKDKILSGVFGLLIPGFGLLNEFTYNDDMTLQEKLDYANRTAASVAKNKGSNTGGNTGGNSGGDTPVEVVDETPVDDYPIKYASVEHFTNVFGKSKF